MNQLCLLFGLALGLHARGRTSGSARATTRCRPYWKVIAPRELSALDSVYQRGLPSDDHTSAAVDPRQCIQRAVCLPACLWQMTKDNIVVPDALIHLHSLRCVFPLVGFHQAVALLLNCHKSDQPDPASPSRQLLCAVWPNIVH